MMTHSQCYVLRPPRSPYLVSTKIEAQCNHWALRAFRESSFFSRRSFFSSFSVALLVFLSFFDLLFSDLCSPLDFFLLSFSVFPG